MCTCTEVGIVIMATVTTGATTLGTGEFALEQQVGLGIRTLG